MMKIISLIILAVFLAANAFSQEDWELKKEDDGIKVYTKYIEGSDIKAFRAEAVMEGKLSSFVAVLKDVDQYPEFYSSSDYAQLLEASDTLLMHYSQTGTPWPVKDRDGVYVNRFSQHYGTKAVTVAIESVEGIRPESDDFVRIEKATGFWKFFPVDYNKVEVIYQMEADPGGNIPAWVVNMFLVDTPFDDMKSLRERVKLEKYANQKFDFLLDY